MQIKTLQQKLATQFKLAETCKKRLVRRLVRGKVYKLLIETKMSEPLRESAMRELERHFPS